jgi:hypothetical protein
MIIECIGCGHANASVQPNAYHAGFANQGLLYDDAGDLTLVWGSFDAAYERIVGARHLLARTLGSYLRDPSAAT